jgi:hypothetical protein
MIELKIQHWGLTPVVNWCGKCIGPQKYYIHNRIGGEKWEARNTLPGGWKLYLKEDKMAVLALLKFGDKLSS